MFELRRQPSYQRRVPGNHADMIGVHDGRKSEKQWMQRGSRETASQPPVLSKAEPVTTGCWLAGRGGEVEATKKKVGVVGSESVPRLPRY